MTILTIIIIALAAGVIVGLRWNDLSEYLLAIGGSVGYYLLLGWGIARRGR